MWRTKSLWVAAFLALSVLQNLTFTCASAEKPSYYTAAVFEYAQPLNCTSDPELAKKNLQFNVDLFSQVARVAKSKGADILVFPEYGLYDECSKSQTTLLCECIPVNPEMKPIPCIEEEEFRDSPILRTFSCIARNNSMVVQANMAEYEECEGEPGCPDGHLQFNTNVVFDRNGALIQRYRKEHLWNEYNFDLPREKQIPKFTVDFGTFLSYVCYDLYLERIIEELTDDVDGIVFSTYWENTMPFGMTVQFFQSFAITMNTTVLAACIQAPAQWAVGSGIFSGQYGALAYTFDPDNLNKLVVARVPRRNQVLEDPKSSSTVVYYNGTTSDWESDGENVGQDGSEVILRKFEVDTSSNIHYHIISLENYTLHQLTEPCASFSECNNGLCCSFEYSSDAITESFYFGVFNGTLQTFDPYNFGQEDCMLVRCNPLNGRECVTFPMWSKDIFHHMSITGNFSSPYVYPSLVNDHFRLIPKSRWNYATQKTPFGYQSDISFESEKGEALLFAGLNGRLYREDPLSSFF